MPIVEAGGIMLAEQQQAIGQGTVRQEHHQGLRPDILRGRSEERMTAVNGAHRDRTQPADRTIDNPGLDRSDIIGLDPESFPVGDQRQRGMIQAEQARPVVPNNVEQGFQAIGFDGTSGLFRSNCAQVQF